MASRPAVGILLHRVASWTGGRVYIENMLLALRALGEKRSFDVILIVGEGQASEGLESLADKTVYLRSNRSMARKIWRQVILRTGNADPRQVEYERQVNLAGANVLFPVFSTDEFAACRRIFWIPDFQHKYLPEFFSEEEVSGRDIHYARIARQATTLVQSSHAAAADCIKFYPDAQGKVEVLQFCSMPKDEWYGDTKPILGRYAVPKRYAIVCNQFWMHKNHIVVFEAIARLKSQGLTLPLVCTGSTTDYRDKEATYFKSLQNRIEALGIEQQVSILGLVPRLDQLFLLRSASVVVQPSRFEGWSTVLEDARVFGKRVVASGIEVHREQNLEGATYFDPDRAEELSERLQEAWMETDLPATPNLQYETKCRADADKRVIAYGQRISHIVEAELLKPASTIK